MVNYQEKNDDRFIIYIFVYLYDPIVYFNKYDDCILLFHTYFNNKSSNKHMYKYNNY